MSTQRYLVVGVDGSEGAEVALRWAVAHAAHFGPVRPVIIWRYPWWAMNLTAPSTIDPPSPAVLEAEAKALAARSLEAVDPDALLDTVAVEGLAGPSLVAAAADAELLVVGTRGRGRLAAGLLGSVSVHCATHSSVPVAIVPADVDIDRVTDRVVVGIDGSSHSVDALVWALRSTPATTTIEATLAWATGTVTVAEVASLAHDRLSALADQRAAETVAAARAGAGRSDRPIEVRTVTGDPRNVLREAAADADLLVVGARGREGVAHLLLGSTATAVATHPTTATVIVP